MNPHINQKVKDQFLIDFGKNLKKLEKKKACLKQSWQ